MIAPQKIVTPKGVPFDYVYSTPRIDSGQYFEPNYLFGALLGIIQNLPGKVTLKPST
jgi:hypothetical protein